MLTATIDTAMAATAMAATATIATATTATHSPAFFPKLKPDVGRKTAAVPMSSPKYETTEEAVKKLIAEELKFGIYTVLCWADSINQCLLIRCDDFEDALVKIDEHVADLKKAALSDNYVEPCLHNTGDRPGVYFEFDGENGRDVHIYQFPHKLTKKHKRRIRGVFPGVAAGAAATAKSRRASAAEVVGGAANRAREAIKSAAAAEVDEATGADPTEVCLSAFAVLLPVALAVILWGRRA